MKRFYKQAGTVPAAGGYAVTLDGRLVKTPGKRDLVVPSAALAAAVAALLAPTALAAVSSENPRARWLRAYPSNRCTIGSACTR